MRQPSVQPILRSLRFLTIHYLNISTRLEADYLGKWIRRLSARSPIESFSLIPGRRDYGPQISLDGLADHISLNHAQTLRTLILERAFIGLHALAQLCARCILLEELAVGTSAHILASTNIDFDVHVNNQYLCRPVSHTLSNVAWNCVQQASGHWASRKVKCR